jgi:hypothetical protein
MMGIPLFPGRYKSWWTMRHGRLSYTPPPDHPLARAQRPSRASTLNLPLPKNHPHPLYSGRFAPSCPPPPSILWLASLWQISYRHSLQFSKVTELAVCFISKYLSAEFIKAFFVSCFLVMIGLPRLPGLTHSNRKIKGIIFISLL